MSAYIDAFLWVGAAIAMVILIVSLVGSVLSARRGQTKPAPSESDAKDGMEGGDA